MDQNWTYLDIRKSAHILKTIFQYFYNLVFLIHRLIATVCDVLHWENFLVMIPFPIFSTGPSVGADDILYRINFLLLPTSFIYIRVSSLLSPLNSASMDIVHDEGSFQFSTEAKFISLSYVHITVATNTEVESPCFVQLVQC